MADNKYTEKEPLNSSDVVPSELAPASGVSVLSDDPTKRFKKCFIFGMAFNAAIGML